MEIGPRCQRAQKRDDGRIARRLPQVVRSLGRIGERVGLRDLDVEPGVEEGTESQEGHLRRIGNEPGSGYVQCERTDEDYAEHANVARQEVRSARFSHRSSGRGEGG